MMQKTDLKVPGDEGSPERHYCTVEQCGASFSKAWRLNQHLCTHTGERPFCCDQPDCDRCFARKDAFRKHKKQHEGVKQFRCEAVDCKADFLTKYQLRKHTRNIHEEALKCTSPGCERTFRKKVALKSHLVEHGGVLPFDCQRLGCEMKFESLAKRRAHHRKHSAYPCPIEDCKTITTTWTGRMKHLKTHPVEYNCLLCGKTFKKQNGLRRHGLSHGPDKPVLLCPREDCKAYFTTAFSLEHHIKKEHLKILNYQCYFPGCERAFAMRVSLTRHLIVHDPDRRKLQLKPLRTERSWKRRCSEPLVEDNLSRLFNWKKLFHFKSKLESDLSGLFNERKIRHEADPEVNLQMLFQLPSTKKSEKAL